MMPPDFYSSVLTGQSFLFYEMRTTAKFVVSGLSDQEIITEIVSNNLFQYPTERTLRRTTRSCLSRLYALENKELVKAILTEPSPVAKQICLYAMMRQSRLAWDFMVTVIGEKYRTGDTTLGKIDFNTFFARLRDQDERVARWKDSSIKRIISTLTKSLSETGYLEKSRSKHLNEVWLYPIVKDAIHQNGDDIVLPAFNCFSQGGSD